MSKSTLEPILACCLGQISPRTNSFIFIFFHTIPASLHREQCLQTFFLPELTFHFPIFFLIFWLRSFINSFYCIIVCTYWTDSLFWCSNHQLEHLKMAWFFQAAPKLTQNFQWAQGKLISLVQTRFWKHLSLKRFYLALNALRVSMLTSMVSDSCLLIALI